MKEQTHTPGPWVVSSYNKGKQLRVRAKHGSLGLHVCGLHINDNREANARLIAASPKMLSACQTAYSQMLQMPHDFLRAKSQQALAELRDSIASALGLDSEYVQSSYEEAIADAILKVRDKS